MKKEKLLEALERISDLVIENNEANATSVQFAKDYNLLLDFIEE